MLAWKNSRAAASLQPQRTHCLTHGGLLRLETRLDHSSCCQVGIVAPPPPLAGHDYSTCSSVFGVSFQLELAKVPSNEPGGLIPGPHLSHLYRLRDLGLTHTVGVESLRSALTSSLSPIPWEYSSFLSWMGCRPRSCLECGVGL